MTHSNRLIHEKSPYLLQHAHNPVDWFPWGEEAFQKAKEEDKPIFLSIGYATCHWCHVMEKESFENEEVASFLNDTFVNIKVDREELPEVDALYMEFAQSMMAGSAGWPLNVILTPDLEPFFAATYLPPRSNPGMTGLIDLVYRIQEVWNSEEKEHVLDQAAKIVNVFSSNVHTRGENMPSEEDVVALSEVLYRLADPVWGGIKGAPKFPIGYQPLFLLRHYSAFKDARSLFLVERTLDCMQRGGIYDHLGGGFSRYSVDEEWLQPHFEKMLYDNALLMDAYLEAYLVTKKPFYKTVVGDIATYLLRDMMSPQGAFYSAEDADSEGEEGRFYTWDKAEILKILGKDEGDLFCNFYGVTSEGNFEGRNILHIPLRTPEFAAKHLLDEELVVEALADCKNKLLNTRARRERPLRDDKILSSWNGLAIHSFARAGISLSEPRYSEAALQAARFIKKHLWVNGTLFRRYRDNDARFSAGLEEYAYMIRAALTLFEAGEGSEWLQWALEMNALLEKNFKSENGAYFQSDGEDSRILLRKIHYSDGAEPSGNAMQCENLLRLYQITFEEKHLRAAEDIFKAVKKFSDNYPPGYTYHLMNLMRYYQKNAPTFIVAFRDDKEEAFIKKLLVNEYIPFKAVVFKRLNDKMLLEGAPLLKLYSPIGEKTALYICHRGACERPLIEREEMEEYVRKFAQTI